MTTYETPFQTTLFYLADDPIGSVLAKYTHRVQPIKLVSLDIDWQGAHELPQYISPQVIFVCNMECVESSVYDNFFKRGFQSIHLFTKSSQNKLEQPTEQPTEQPVEQSTEQSNQNIQKFTYDNFYEHVRCSHLSDMVIVDMILKYVNYQYVGCTNVTHGDAVCFMRAIKTYGWEALPANNIHMFDNITHMVNKGRGILDERERLANLALSRGVVHGSVLLVMGCDFGEEMSALALVHPNKVKNNCDYVICYDVSNLRVKLHGLSTTKSVLHLFRDWEPTGTFGDSYCSIRDATWPDVLATLDGHIKDTNTL
jgi:hypothetical protein